MMVKKERRNLIRCRCGWILGQQAAGHIIIKYQGREILASDVIAITCEHCGAVWKPSLDKQGSNQV